MGKRKSAKKPQAKRTKETLSTSFKCVFCNHDKSVTVKIDKINLIGNLSCKTCAQRFSSPINNLSAAVDVYCDWVDACEEARAKQPVKKPKASRAAPAAALPPLSDEEDDDRASTHDRYESKRKSARNAYDDDDEEEERPRKVRRNYDYDDDEDDE